jgi:hypothetical protein
MNKFITLLLFLISACAFGQDVQRKEKIAGLNAYVYYPMGYDTEPNQRFPLIVFFPGKGEAGTVDSLLLRNGPSRFIAQGVLKPPALVMSVQPTYGWVDENTIDKVLVDIVKRWRVDTLNVSLTGLSAGATGIERYALTPKYSTKITSLVPMSAPEVPTYMKYIPEVVKAKVPWLGFIGSKDSHYLKMKALFDQINTYSPGLARLIVGNYNHDCCWNDFYNPNYKLDSGKNIYEWMIGNGKGPSIELPQDTIHFITIPHNPKDVYKVLILDKSGKWHEYDSNSVKSGGIKVEFH